MNQFAWAVIRIIAGALLVILHGYPTVFGGKMETFTQTMISLGFPKPHWFAWAAALSELVGGSLVALGLATRLGGLFATATVAVAIYREVLRGVGPNLELPLLYFGPMLAALLMGGGLFSLDALLFRPSAPSGRRF